MNDLWPEEREQLPPEDRHDQTDVSVRGLLLVAAGLVLLAALALIGADLLTPRDADIAARRSARDPRLIDEPPDPRITQSHRLQRLELERRVDSQLSTYAWIDREQGIARIPIERAVELVLENGFPAPSGPAEDRPAENRPDGTAQERQPDED